MTDSSQQKPSNGIIEPHCQYFVMRKKRLCRMTVRPGRQYCGEHEPQPNTTDGQDDKRIPCPNDHKHTVYVSKLEKHLRICNARTTEQPPYIVPNINAPTEVDDTCPRKPLSQLPRETVMQVIDKVNFLYEKHVKDNITTSPDYPIHSTVMEEFSENDRAESSLRHLRQVSSLLWLAEEEGLVADNTCYVELGAGKGHVSYYACNAWCDAQSCTLLVDRASLRHKRDNKLRSRTAARLRADLAHVALQRVPLVASCDAVVGLAKHLCGVATDYALRCITAEGVLHKTRGIVLATCCHHRCERAAFVASQQLQEMGLSGEEFNVMLGIVSWATCGSGRSRGSGAAGMAGRAGLAQDERAGLAQDERAGLAQDERAGLAQDERAGLAQDERAGLAQDERAGLAQDERAGLAQDERAGLAQDERAGLAQDERAGLAQDERAGLAQDERAGLAQDERAGLAQDERAGLAQDERAGLAQDERAGLAQDERAGLAQDERAGLAQDERAGLAQDERAGLAQDERAGLAQDERAGLAQDERAGLAQDERARVGRRAKQLLDWARVLHLRGRGFDARLCHFVSAAVSLENVCIVAKKLS